MPMSNHTPLEDMSAGRGQGGGGPPQNCLKVFIQRDYSDGTMVKFQTRFPTELGDRLDRQSFEYTINQLNNYFAEAERASCSTYCEGCLACLTGYLIYICTETHYEKCLRKIAKFVLLDCNCGGYHVWATDNPILHRDLLLYISGDKEALYDQTDL